MIDMQIT